MNKRPYLIYEFGPYRLDLFGCRLYRYGREIILRPKLFDLLVVLVEHRGQMLEKDQLLNSVWTGASVEDSNLTVSINALRRVLSDAAYIETVTRRGYRFTADVKVVPFNAGAGAAALPATSDLDPPGGAMPLYSHLYVPRRTDEEFYAAVERRDSIVLIKGARQVGKTSLLARGLQRVREQKAAVVLTDFQQLTAASFETVEKLLLTLAELIADQLELETPPHQVWNSFLSPGSNFERYMRREVLTKFPTPLVWGMDETDRLFNYAYASEVFGLIRSWHNLRALDPEGPWQRLTLALAYATEAHLFISDLNQSPFNVGTRLTLEDFTAEQVALLNERYGEPLCEETEVAGFYELTGGHPYLTQRGLYEMVHRKTGLAAIEAKAVDEEGPFGDHLRRLLMSLEREKALCDAIRSVLQGQAGLTIANFYRLRSAGVLSGDSPQDARPRCELYARYLKRRLL